jgi:hypothetical protein
MADEFGACPVNRIVKEHYPAARLPDDLREGIDPGGTVTVTVVTEKPSAGRSKRDLYGVAKSRATSVRDAVLRVRQLRDEWN